MRVLSRGGLDAIDGLSDDLSAGVTSSDDLAARILRVLSRGGLDAIDEVLLVGGCLVERPGRFSELAGCREDEDGCVADSEDGGWGRR